MTWAQGIQDAISISEDLIREYDGFYLQQKALIADGVGNAKLAADWSLVINALERLVELLKDLQPPGPESA